MDDTLAEAHTSLAFIKFAGTAIVWKLNASFNWRSIQADLRAGSSVVQLLPGRAGTV